jgi:cysteine-rich repeat protein
VVDSGEGCDPPDGTTCDPQCRPVLCGNGDLDEGEACDNGSANSNTTPDACRTNCELPRCGDSVTDPVNEEDCDDGNASNADACLGTCVDNTCGDGFRNPAAEECDDGNGVDTDACLTGCTLNVCGDGKRNPAQEDCDDGNGSDADPCTNDCEVAACGDGSTCSASACTTGPTGAAEECDDGAANSDTAPNACRTRCASPFCGDGVIDTGEGCDDGAANGTAPDGCSTECTRPAVCSILFRVTTAGTLGALKYEVDFTAAPGQFAGSGLTVACTNLLAASSNFFEDETNEILRHSIISLGGFTTPADLANCSFTATGTPEPGQFAITVTDASTPDLQPASPTVTVSSITCDTP